MSDNLLAAPPDMIGSTSGETIAKGAYFTAGTTIHAPDGFKPIEAICVDNWGHERHDRRRTAPQLAVPLRRASAKAGARSSGGSLSAEAEGGGCGVVSTQRLKLSETNRRFWIGWSHRTAR